MGRAADPRVDAYIEALPEWQQAICHEVRELVHAADPEVDETIKRTVQPYFVLQGNVCALLAAKDHVNVFLYDGAIVPDPDGIITSGHENKTARTVVVPAGRARSTAPALTAMCARSSPTTAPAAGARSRRGAARRFDLARSPGLVEERLQRVVEPQDHEEALAGDGLQPVVDSLPAGAVGPM